MRTSRSWLRASRDAAPDAGRRARPGRPSDVSPPPGAPERPVHGGALLRLGRLEPLVGDLPLESQPFVLAVGVLVTDVEALAAVRVGIAIDDVPVLRLRDDLQCGHRTELLRSLRR